MTAVHPGQIQAPNPNNPNFFTASQTKKEFWTTPKKAVAIGAAAISLLGASWGANKVASTVLADQLADKLIPDTATSAPAVPGETTESKVETAIDGTKVDIAIYPHDGDVINQLPAFNKLPLGVQIDAVAPYVNEHVQEWWNNYNTILSEKRGPNFHIGSPELEPISPDNDATTIASRAIAIIQETRTNSNHNLSMNIISAKTSPENSELYDADIDIADGGADSFSSPKAIFDELPMFDTGSFYNIEANGIPTKPFRIYNYDTDTTSVNVYQYAKGEQNPDAAAWVLVAAGSVNDPIGKAYQLMPGANPLPANAH
jgi:hypothetical protein